MMPILSNWVGSGDTYYDPGWKGAGLLTFDVVYTDRGATFSLYQGC